MIHMPAASIRLIASLLVLALSASVASAQPGKSRATVDAAANYTALQPGQQAVVAVVIDIAKGFHAQSHNPSDENFIKFEVKLDDHPALKKFAPISPAGETPTYPALGPLNIYDGQVLVFVPVELKSDAPVGPLELKGKATY